MFEMIASALIGGATSLLSGNKAQKDENKRQEKSLKFQRENVARTTGLMQPYMSAGTDALSKYRSAVGLDGAAKQSQFYDDFQHDPGFQEGLDRSLDDTMKKYSIYGDTGGGLAKDLVKTGQEARYGQYTQRLQQLGGLIDTGRAAGGTVAAAGMNSADQSSAAVGNSGNFMASGIVNAGNAAIGGLQNNALMNMWQQGQTSGRNPGAGGWNTQTVNNAGW